MKVIVLDLDGTLYDKRYLSLRMACHAIKDIRKMLAERRVRSSMKGQWIDNPTLFQQTYFQQLAQHLHCSEQSAEAWYEHKYMPLMVRLIGKYQHAYPWVMPLIDACKKAGIRIVVLSDYGHTHAKLHALNISPTLFDWVVAAPELGGLKPARELLYIIAERMGVRCEDCCVVGDREDTDGEMARTAGAQFCHVTPTTDILAEVEWIGEFGTDFEIKTTKQ